jgi:hypothetical protein
LFLQKETIQYQIKTPHFQPPTVSGKEIRVIVYRSATDVKQPSILRRFHASDATEQIPRNSAPYFCSSNALLEIVLPIFEWNASSNSCVNDLFPENSFPDY